LCSRTYLLGLLHHELLLREHLGRLGGREAALVLVLDLQALPPGSLGQGPAVALVRVGHAQALPQRVVLRGELHRALRELLDSLARGLVLELEARRLAPEARGLLHERVDVLVLVGGRSHLREHLLVLELLGRRLAVGVDLAHRELSERTGRVRGEGGCGGKSGG
jgi:hypothetical protein